MKKVLVLALALAACESNPENSAVCGFSAIASAAMTLSFMPNEQARITSPPGGLPATLPAKVVGFGTSRVLISDSPTGLVMGFEGAGFPATPGFGILIVDDSSEVVRGVLIFDKEVQEGMPRLGTISGTTSTIPLYGLRVNWGSVSDVRCPMFSAKRDSTAN